MYKVNQKTAPNVFYSRFQKPSHFYPIKILGTDKLYDFTV